MLETAFRTDVAGFVSRRHFLQAKKGQKGSCGMWHFSQMGDNNVIMTEDFETVTSMQSLESLRYHVHNYAQCCCGKFDIFVTVTILFEPVKIHF